METIKVLKVLSQSARNVANQGSYADRENDRMAENEELERYAEELEAEYAEALRLKEQNI